MSIPRFLKNIFKYNDRKKTARRYIKRFANYSYIDCNCTSIEQFEASITRLYHTVEKGLSYLDYRAGFGTENIRKLLITLEQYSSMGYDTSSFFYETALSCLTAYIDKNKEHGYEDAKLEERIKKLHGRPNDFGGTITVTAPINPEKMTYAEIVSTRHSIRHFSDTPIDNELLKEAIRLAQFTPSACNRQGWKTRIVADKDKIRLILNNQNGNRGFGQSIDKLLVVTADLRAQQRNRELFQAFIDGGMYAESVLNSLFSKGIGSVPLSASLTTAQEDQVRHIVGMDDAEILILFIGVGNYPEMEILTTRSERKPIIVEEI